MTLPDVRLVKPLASASIGPPRKLDDSLSFCAL
jgi:hypothetical protein